MSKSDLVQCPECDGKCVCGDGENAFQCQLCDGKGVVDATVCARYFGDQESMTPEVLEECKKIIMSQDSQYWTGCLVTLIEGRFHTTVLEESKRQLRMYVDLIIANSKAQQRIESGRQLIEIFGDMNKNVNI